MDPRVDRATQHSVLGTLAESLGSVPRVLLRESELGGLTPVVHPSSREMPAGDPGRERYQFLGEIARGGMGAVLKGRDTDLGRDLAVKVLLEKHRDKPGLIRRFIEEAQIGGQLQHPGIVPVYELGCFEDRRPFFTMKLVRGHTLAALLDARPDPAHERPRFLAVFEAACQTMAYAHARGVIHRDLKPHNIMVGSFGEVQVMDWGLAKVLRTASVIGERTPEPERETIVETARSASETYASRAGSVLGTPAYMPPEQASGELEAVDERADVFAMGAILCEILTGRPPYSGRTEAEIQRKAVAGDLSEAFERLAGCGAEADLLELARCCLAPRAQDRPRDAGEVARAMTAHLAGVQERLRAAELARVEAQARIEEERKRRKTQFRMAAAILIALVLGTAGVVSQWRRAEANLRKAESRFDLAREAIERFYTGASEDVLLKEPQLKPLREKLLGSRSSSTRSCRPRSSPRPAGSPGPSSPRPTSAWARSPARSAPTPRRSRSWGGRGRSASGWPSGSPGMPGLSRTWPTSWRRKASTSPPWWDGPTRRSIACGGRGRSASGWRMTPPGPPADRSSWPTPMSGWVSCWATP